MSQRFPIRFSDRTWNLIDAAATAEGITPASWVRRLVEGHLGARCPACGGSRETPEVVPFHGAGYAGAPATAKRCEDVFHASIRKGSYHVPQTAPEGLSQPRSASESRRSTSEALLNWASRQDRQTPIQDNIDRNSNSYVGDEKMRFPKHGAARYASGICEVYDNNGKKIKP